MAAFAAVIFGFNLGGAVLFDEDEPKNAACGREMWERGDWLVPTFNHELRTAKPILLYWMMLGCYSLWGVHEWTARLPSACCSIMTILMTYSLGRLVHQRISGLLAATMLGTCLFFVAVGRAATPDACLISSLMGFMACYWGAEIVALKWIDANQLNSKMTHNLDRGLRVASGVCLGLAVLAKGPIGIVLPCLIVWCWRLIESMIHAETSGIHSQSGTELAFANIKNWAVRWLNLGVQVVLQGELSLLIVVALAVSLPWYVLVGYETSGAWLVGFLGDHNAGRFLHPMENHSGWVIYYLPAIMLGALPWSVLFPYAITILWSRRQHLWRDTQSTKQLDEVEVHDEGSPEHQMEELALRFIRWLLVWCVVWVVFFSLAQTKLPNYVLPVYPPLCLLTVITVRKWGSLYNLPVIYWRITGAVFILLGTALLTVMPWLAHQYLAGEWSISLVGVPPVLGGMLLLWLGDRDSKKIILGTTGMLTVCWCLIIFGYVGPIVARHQEGYVLGQWLKTVKASDHPIATTDYFSPNLVYYSGSHILRIRSEDLTTFLKQYPQGILLTRDDRWQQTAINHIPLTIVKQHRRFLRHHAIVAIQRAEQPTDVLPALHQE